MIPITIVTGFLGSGKTTLILNLIPQLPKDYKLALLKNEFGDVAIDSQLASSAAISGVKELLNGCICCNLVGQLGDALDTLRREVEPDRIIIETSGSAFPATLALEVNRLGRESRNYVLDGVVSVIDVENWKGYEDTSYTAKMQARYTDLIVFNKWELVDERRYDECLDRLGDLDLQVANVKSDKGFIPQDLLLGLDNALVNNLDAFGEVAKNGHSHDHASDHQSEVEVLSITLPQASEGERGVDIQCLTSLLSLAPKDEIYRIKAILVVSSSPTSSDGVQANPDHQEGALVQYILNWAFGRWTFTPISSDLTAKDERKSLSMTIITARYESEKWRKKITTNGYIKTEGSGGTQALEIRRIG